jgi:carboxypeptidase family protein
MSPNAARPRPLALRTTRAFCPGLALLLMLATAPGLFAQVTGNATLRGTVSDSTGAVLPGASVSLINERTREQRTATTDSRGGYFFAAVVPSTYTVRVEISGFKTREAKGLTISFADARGLDVTLEVGQQSETVTVTAEAEIIQTETGAREGLLNAKQIDNLSIIGRSSIELLRIMPGVVAPDQTQMESVGFITGANNTASYTVNGVRGTNNTVSLDGSRLIDIGSNSGLIISPNNDMVQEVKVQSSNYAAEFGTSGVHIAATTKGGGSEFHGTLYDYLRDHRFAANDRSNSIAGIEKPKSSFHYPGGNLSGPVLIPGTGFNKNRDKMFFFLGLEIQRQKVDNGSRFTVVPTLGQREGVFNDLGGGQHLNQPTTVNIPGGFPGAGTPAPNNDLRPYINPVGRALIGLYPTPNYNDPDNRYNYVYSQLEPNNRWESTLRLDYNITENTKAYLRLAYSKEELTQPRGLWWGASDVELPTPNLASSRGRSASLNVVHVLNPTMTNELLLTASKLELDNDYKDPSKVSLESLGIGSFRGFFPRQVDYAPLNLVTWGDQGIGNLNAAGNPLFAHNDTIQLADSVTKVLNTHVIKFGASVEQVTKKQNFQNNEEIEFEFASWGQPGATGSTLGDMIVGRPVQVTQGTKTPNGHFRHYNIDAYVQDSWKIKPNFTLEYGVRVARMPNNTEINGLGAVFIPQDYDRSQGPFINGDVRRLNGVSYAATGDVPDRLIPNRPTYFMPRINFAWDLGGKGDTVIRGGGGLFYNRAQGNAEYDVLRLAPNSYSAKIDSWGGEGLGGGQGLTFDTLRLVDPYTRLGAQSVVSINPDSIDYPRITTMSLSVARRIPFQQVLEVAYVGSLARHLQQRRKANTIPEGFLLTNHPGVSSDLTVPVNRAALNSDLVNTFKPFPAFNEVTFVEYTGTSAYHSAQVTLSRQTGKRFQYFLAYTFSKSLGTTTLNENDGNGLDPLDPRSRSWGILPSDRTHILNVSYNYTAPDLAPKGFNNAVTRGLLNGWQISGISTFSSGSPLKVRFSGDLQSTNAGLAWAGTPSHNVSSGNTVGPVAPDFRGNPQRGGGGVGDHILDINQIVIPAFPNSGPYVSPFYLRTPSRMNHDITLFKNFRINDKQRLQFRAGLFNVFNQAYATSAIANDIDGSAGGGTGEVRLDTVCNVRRSGVPNGAGGTTEVCDPTGGYSFTEQTKQNFGKVNLLRGHRIVEFALKFYF